MNSADYASSRFQWLLKVLQQLYKLGFRLISHEVNMTVRPWKSDTLVLYFINMDKHKTIFFFLTKKGLKSKFSGEEPVCNEGLPRLPRDRPHEGQYLEFFGPDLEVCLCVLDFTMSGPKTRILLFCNQIIVISWVILDLNLQRLVDVIELCINNCVLRNEIYLWSGYVTDITFIIYKYTSKQNDFTLGC